MQIYSISPQIQSVKRLYKKPLNCIAKCHNSISNISFCSHDVFQKLNKNDITYTDFVNKNGATTNLECQEIIKKYPKILKEAYNEINSKSADCRALSPKDTAFTVSKIKDYFDKQYGKNGYRIISIGTSPSVIAKGLQITGAEVYYMPISGVRCTTYYPNIRLDEYRNANISLNYLESQGFLPEKDDEKTNIVLDYVSSGATLNSIAELIEQKFKIPPYKIIAKSITGLIRDAFNINQVYNAQLTEIHLKLENEMGYQKTEAYSNIPHFNVIESLNECTDKYTIASSGLSEEEVFEKFKNFSRPLARAYELCLTNELLNKPIPNS